VCVGLRSTCFVAKEDDMCSFLQHFFPKKNVQKDDRNHLNHSIATLNSRKSSVHPVKTLEEVEDINMSDIYEPHDRVRTEAHIKSVEEYKKR